MVSISFEEIKQKALELGWDDAGVTFARIPEEDIQAYRKWLSDGMHGNLSYMENQLRCDPQALFPGAKYAIIFVSYYKQDKVDFNSEGGVIASYARGRDYHHIHRKRIKKYIDWLEKRSGQQGIAKGFSDSTPVLEKTLAVRAGLGWFGKNTLLIHKKFGTFTLLAGLFTSLEIGQARDEPRLPRCGTCQKCLDACPTGALQNPYILDAKKCLSYHLIEMKGAVDPSIADKNPGYAFGCDLCQDACPHNARKDNATNADFTEAKGMGSFLRLAEISHLEEEPQRLFGTPLQRRGVAGLKENLTSLKQGRAILSQGVPGG